MPLQQINWLQIDTQTIPSGSQITLGGPSNRFEAVYAKNLNTSGSLLITGSIETTGDLFVGGNLTVAGTTTAVNSTIIELGDNIIALNGTEGAFAGIQVNDPTNPNKISGSLLWDTLEDYWIAGPSGSEQRIILEDEFLALSASINTSIAGSGIWGQTGSFWATTNDLQVTGSMPIKGNLRVEGTTTLIQTVDPNMESLIVSGAMSIVKNQINTQMVSASLAIENLGTIADRSKFAVIDCGDGFF